jgi:hypothetical protein
MLLLFFFPLGFPLWLRGKGNRDVSLIVGSKKESKQNKKK